MKVTDIRTQMHMKEWQKSRDAILYLRHFRLLCKKPCIISYIKYLLHHPLDRRLYE